MAVVAEELFHHRAAVGDKDAAAGKNLQQAAGAHGFRISNGIDVERYGILFIHSGSFRIRNLVVYSQCGFVRIAEFKKMRQAVAVPVENMQKHRRLFAYGKQHIQKAAAAVQNLPVIAAHKAGFVSFKRKTRKIMERRLIRHGQHLDPALTRQMSFVSRHAGIVGGEDVRKKARHINESIEECTVILIPEYGGDAPVPGQLHQAGNGARPAHADVFGLFGQLIAPFSLHAMKGGFNKDKVRPPVTNDIPVIVRRERANAAFGGKTGCSEIVG